MYKEKSAVLLINLIAALDKLQIENSPNRLNTKNEWTI